MHKMWLGWAAILAMLLLAPAAQAGGDYRYDDYGYAVSHDRYDNRYYDDHRGHSTEYYYGYSHPRPFYDVPRYYVPPHYAPRYYGHRHHGWRHSPYRHGGRGWRHGPYRHHRNRW